jgi:hypothetical protein
LAARLVASGRTLVFSAALTETPPSSRSLWKMIWAPKNGRLPFSPIVPTNA